MSERSAKYKFPGEIDRDHLRTEQPIDPMINRRIQMPNPLDPMGNIAMEGRAMQNLSSGRVPMWVLMSSWATIGLLSFLLLVMRPSAPIVLLALLFITILFRATWRKRG
jgi:hypothetical protein